MVQCSWNNELVVNICMDHHEGHEDQLPTPLLSCKDGALRNVSGISSCLLTTRNGNDPEQEWVIILSQNGDD